MGCGVAGEYFVRVWRRRSAWRPGSAAAQGWGRNGRGTPDISCNGAAANAMCDKTGRITATQDSLAAALVIHGDAELCESAAGHFFCRNTSGSMPACFKMARSVPSGISPGWLGMVV